VKITVSLVDGGESGNSAGRVEAVVSAEGESKKSAATKRITKLRHSFVFGETCRGDSCRASPAVLSVQRMLWCKGAGGRREWNHSKSPEARTEFRRHRVYHRVNTIRSGQSGKEGSRGERYFRMLLNTSKTDARRGVAFCKPTSR